MLNNYFAILFATSSLYTLNRKKKKERKTPAKIKEEIVIEALVINIQVNYIVTINLKLFQLHSSTFFNFLFIIIFILYKHFNEINHLW